MATELAQISSCSSVKPWRSKLILCLAGDVIHLRFKRWREQAGKTSRCSDCAHIKRENGWELMNQNLRRAWWKTRMLIIIIFTENHSVSPQEYDQLVNQSFFASLMALCLSQNRTQNNCGGLVQHGLSRVSWLLNSWSSMADYCSFKVGSKLDLLPELKLCPS